MSVSATAKEAVAAAFEAAGDAKTTVTLRMGPSESAYDPDTDTTTLTWEQETSALAAIGYQDATMRRATALIETRTRSFILRGSDVTASDPTQAGEIEEDGVVWQIVEAVPDPTRAVWIFHCTA